MYLLLNRGSSVPKPTSKLNQRRQYSYDLKAFGNQYSLVQSQGIWVVTAVVASDRIPDANITPQLEET
jgi:hypothetical protein